MQLYERWTSVHMENALRYGAAIEEILEVMEIASVIGHLCSHHRRRADHSRRSRPLRSTSDCIVTVIENEVGIVVPREEPRLSRPCQPLPQGFRAAAEWSMATTRTQPPSYF